MKGVWKLHRCPLGTVDNEGVLRVVATGFQRPGRQIFPFTLFAVTQALPISQTSISLRYTPAKIRAEGLCPDYAEREHAWVGKAPSAPPVSNCQPLLAFLGQPQEVNAIVGDAGNRTGCAVKTQVPGNVPVSGRVLVWITAYRPIVT